MEQIMRKIPAVLLAGLMAVAVAFAIGAFTAQEAHAIEGDGGNGSPYKIASYEDLKEFADIVNGENGKTPNPNAWAILTKDIVCNDTTWVPIGASGNQFTGHFDGKGHTIKNLSNAGIDNIESTSNQGLFGFIGDYGEVKNVFLEDGKITGNQNVGGIAGSAGSTIGFGAIIACCRNTGVVSGAHYVGGITGGVDNGVKITNCYNTGAVSGGGYVGGIAGNPGGEITNCYNTGAVSGNRGIGGIVGWNSNSGNISNCYNTGAVSGTGDSIGNIGGIAGKRTDENCPITNCYFDTAFCTGVSALGDGDDPDTVKGLDTSQMTGSGVIGSDSMDFQYGEGEESPWLTRQGGYDPESGNYYWYYPHLKGFDFDSNGFQVNASKIEPEDWPAKVIVNTTWRELASYTYNGSDQGPEVLKITVSEESVAVPKGANDIQYSKWDGSDWAELSSDEPTDPGVYKLSYTVGDDSRDIIFSILEQGPEHDYTVEYLLKKETGGSVTEAIDAGDYKAIVTFKNGDSLEKEFKIEPASIAATVNGSSTEKTYNGVEQTYTGTVTAASSDTAFDATKFQYTGSAEVKGTKFGEYTAELAAGNCTYGDPNYKVTWTIGDPVKLTIEKAPLTIKAKDQTFTYNGKTQGEGDTVYADAAQIAEKVTASGLQGSDKLTSIVIDGQGTEIGEYPITLSGAAVGNATDNYDISYVNGTLRITKPQPKPTPPQPKPDPKPQPKINKAAAKTSLDAGVVAKSSGSKVTASWGAVKGASSYVIYANYCDQKTLKKIRTVSGKTTSFDITKLNGKKFNPKKNLKFYVVAYQKVNGKTVKLSRSIMAHAPGSKNSKRTNVIGVKVKKASFTLKKGKTAKIKAKLVLEKKNKKPLKHCAKFRYATSNAKVAKVSKKGKITAVGKGKCTVYVYAVSGVSKKIKITVK